MVDECITVGTAQFRLNTPVKERLAILEELKTRYPDAADGEKQGVSCYVERDEGQQMQEGFYRVADYREAFVILAAGEEHLEEYIDDGSQHIILVGQRTAFEVITQIVQTVVIQAVGSQHGITVYHTHILTQHSQL